jgi:hypothetical protein
MSVVGTVRQTSPGLCDPHGASVGFFNRFRKSGCYSLRHDPIDCAALVQILVNHPRNYLWYQAQFFEQIKKVYGRHGVESEFSSWARDLKSMPLTTRAQ